MCPILATCLSTSSYELTFLNTVVVLSVADYGKQPFFSNPESHKQNNSVVSWIRRLAGFIRSTALASDVQTQLHFCQFYPWLTVLLSAPEYCYEFWWRSYGSCERNRENLQELGQGQNCRDRQSRRYETLIDADDQVMLICHWAAVNNTAVINLWRIISSTLTLKQRNF